MPPDDMRGSWAEGVPTEARDILGPASHLLLGAGALFIAWSVLFPIGSAVVSDGVVIATGQNKALQHRVGGVITEIRARDGEVVASGATVLRLDPVHDQAELTRFKGRLAILDAMRQRLEAENAYAAGGEGALQGSFNLLGLRRAVGEPPPVQVAALTAPGEARPEGQLLAEQQREFERGRGAAQAEVAAMLARRDALRRRGEGITERLAVVSAQVAALDRQVTAMRPVANRGHLARKVLWDAEDQLLGRRAERANLQAEERAIADEVDETHSRVRLARLADQRQTSGKLTEVIAEIGQLSDQIRAAEQAVRATDVRAPVAGTVVHSKHTTVGGVVAPGEVLAQIVPSGSELAFKARIPPTDITHVKPGQSARVKISALNARVYDDVPAEVARVDADATIDEKTGQHYFAVEIRLKTEAYPGRVLLGAGMVGQAYIEGESRTLASYMLRPLVESLGRSFREH